MARIIIRERKGKHDRTETEFFVPDETHDFHTESGMITKAQLAKGGVVTLGKERFRIMTPNFSDSYARLKRGAQIVQPKDLGYVIAFTGLSKEDTILDIGAGSGASGILFARIAKQVYAYDVNEEHLKIAQQNARELTIKNYAAKKGDASDPSTIPHTEEIDLFFLDVPEPWKALATAEKALKAGGWLVGYTPTVGQMTKLVDALPASFHHVKSVELMERDWKVVEPAVRPESKDFQHTAFLSFIRKS